MTPERIAELKKLAKAATPGPWVAWRPYLNLGQMTVHGVIPRSNLHPEEPYKVESVHTRGTRSFAIEVAVPSGATAADDGSDAAKNMEFIAAFNPQSVLELISAFESEKRRADELAHYGAGHLNSNRAEVVALRATLRTMLADLEESRKECMEQSRLNGIGSEREAKLLAEIGAAKREVERLKAMIRRSEE